MGNIDMKPDGLVCHEYGTGGICNYPVGIIFFQMTGSRAIIVCTSAKQLIVFQAPGELVT